MLVLGLMCGGVTQRGVAATADREPAAAADVSIDLGERVRRLAAGIDAAIETRLAEARIEPAAEADRRTLIRRLTFDITGLPPTPAEVAAFVDDEAGDAYDRLVERLLASRHYGERQARLWLDVVRYADTNGYERDEFRPLIWRYRDACIAAFNADLPFDRFVREQLAGDELVNGPPQTEADVRALVATGFLRLGQWDSTAAIFQEETRLRAEVLADLTNTTAAAFLGLTMACCQCHDHKYDPLSQADHYRLRACFAGVTPRDDLVIDLPEARRAIEAHNAAAAENERRAFSLAMGATDDGPEPPVTRILYQGAHDEPRQAVEPGVPAILGAAALEIVPPGPQSSGRRLALANWIAASDNPRTTRVIVNRIWQQHFTVGLVATPDDFGVTGAEPTHPELLDRLATEFGDGLGWSLKALHRALVTTRTYRRSSAAEPSGSAVIDPDNRFLWRQHVRRLDAEGLRDSLLAVSGLLQECDGGPPRWPAVPEEVLRAQPAILEAFEGKDEGRRQGWYADPDAACDVRSIFLVRKRCLPIPLLEAFDLPDTTVTCGRRDSTVVAPQALALLNGPTAVRCAEALAARVRDDAGRAGTEADLVRQAFWWTLGRPPDAEEQSLAADFLRRHADAAQAGPEAKASAGGVADAGAGAEPPPRALVELCRALLNTNEFVYLD